MSKILTKYCHRRLARACEQNMREWYLRKLQVSGDDVKIENGLIWAYSPQSRSYPGLGNNIPFPSLRRSDSRLLKKVVKFYNRRNVDAWCTCGKATTPKHVRSLLRKEGFALRLPNLGMACPLNRINKRFSMPHGLKIEILADSAIFKKHKHPSFGSINNQSSKKALKASLNSALRNPGQVWNFLATIRGKPVGNAMLSLSHGVAGIYDIGVNRSMRRKSIGSAVTIAACEQAKDLGFKFAVLQTNPGLRRFYEGLGFKEVTLTEYWYYAHKYEGEVSKTLTSVQLSEILLIEEFLITLLTGSEKKAIQLLKKHPKMASLKVRGFADATLLHIAAWNGFSDTVKALISMGANLNARESDFKGTPLHWAAHGAGPDGPILKRDHLGVINVLLGAGAWPKAVNKFNISAKFIARKSHNKRIYKALEPFWA